MSSKSCSGDKFKLDRTFTKGEKYQVRFLLGTFYRPKKLLSKKNK